MLRFSYILCLVVLLNGVFCYNSRVKRSPDQKQPWELNPNVDRDENGNVRTDINVKRNGESSDIEAGWSKVIKGPNKSKPTWHVGGTIKWRRSTDTVDNIDKIDESRIKRSLEHDQPWALNPNVARDGDGNVRTDVNIKRTGENNDFEAGWSKVVHGPDKAKPTWHVGGTIRWRRSDDEVDNIYKTDGSRIKRYPEDQPWTLNPNVERDGAGNVQTDVNIKRTGENNDFEAGWSKVVHGPNKAKPTWHVGGTIRSRRSAYELNNIYESDGFRIKRSAEDQPWTLNPNVGRDGDGNVKTDVIIKRNGENNDFEAGWSKVVRGPNKAKPTWHIGGTIRWRRSADAVDNIYETDASRSKRSPEDQPWSLNPNVARDGDGNVRTDVNIKQTGENNDVEAGWSKVVRGPNKAKPTWHVGGTIRWRRSADELNNVYETDESRSKRSPEDQPWTLNPNVARDGDENVKTDVNIKRTGENNDFEAGWSKVVHGPNKAKPTWHVGGTIRWRRSAGEIDNIDEIDVSRMKRSIKEGQASDLNPNVDNSDVDSIDESRIQRSLGRHYP